MNSKGVFHKAIYFALGFLGWFFVQSIYSSVAVKYDIPVLACVAIPTNIIVILVIFLRKNRWIASGIGIGFAFNGIALIYMGEHSVINDDAFIGWFFLFPPVVLFYNNWLVKLR